MVFFLPMNDIKFKAKNDHTGSQDLKVPVARDRHDLDLQDHIILMI